jgi:hypothetical protein
MVQILSPLYLKGVVVYIDDTVVYGKTAEEFLDRLEQTFQLMAQGNVRLKATKCSFGFESIEFLGHVISKEGVRLSDKRVQGILDMPLPTTVSSVRRFIGMVNYFRNFIPRLSEIIAPLTALTRNTTTKRQAVSWTPEAQTAWESTRKALMSSMTTVILNETDPLILYTDASMVAVSGILFQVQDGVEKPAICVSKKLSEPASRWPVTELELFAVVFSCMTLRSYLLGRPFTLRTDHKNLVYLASSQIPKLVRWRLQLAEFQFVVEHIPGDSNVVADAISRHRQAVTDSDIVLSEEDKRKYIQSVHNTIVGHHGINRTFEILQAHDISWPTMRQDIKEFIKYCMVCQKTHYGTTQSKQVSAATDHHLYGSYPMESLSIDTAGPYPVDSRGRKYILVIIDNFSKFCGLYATVNVTSVDFMEALLQWIGLFGAPKRIRTDQGTQFTSKLAEDMSAFLKYDHLKIVAYSPQANGLVERRNAELGKHLRALCLDRRVETKWSYYLPLVQRILNFTIDGSTGTQPARIIFGDMLPLEHAFDTDLPDRPVEVSQYLIELSTAQKALIEASQAYLSANQRRRAAPISISDRPIAVGDYILLTYPSRPPSKLASLYRGPFIVTDHDHDMLYTVLDLISNKHLTVHARRLIPFDVAPDVMPNDLVAMAAADQHEFLVEAIVDHKKQGGSKKEWLFRVRWQ